MATLTSPAGNKFTVDDPAEIINLQARGYKLEEEGKQDSKAEQKAPAKTESKSTK